MKLITLFREFLEAAAARFRNRIIVYALQLSGAQPRPQHQVLKVLPVIGNTAVAESWRFWTQRNEFYASSAYLQKANPHYKLSFHSDGNWVMKVGELRKHLHSGLKYEGGWSHLLHMHFIILPDALKPPAPLFESLVPFTSKTKLLTLLECKLGTVLRLDFYVHKSAKRPPCPILNEPSVHKLTELPLRGGGIVVAMRRTMMWDAAAQWHIDAMSREPPIRVSGPSRPSPRNVYAEYQLFSSTPEHGNYIVIIPLPLSRFMYRAPSHEGEVQ